jgi:hypothetical protein
MSKLRRNLYRTASRLGDVESPTPAHFARKAAYRGMGRAMRGTGCLVPVVAVLVALVAVWWPL